MDKIKEIAKEICDKYNVHMSSESLDAFASILKPLRLLRSESPFEKGDVCDCMYYIKRGLVIQQYEKNGVKVVEHISHEGDMVICIESTFTHTPSEIEVTMLEPGLLLSIPYADMRHLATLYKEIYDLIFGILELSLIVSQHKADMLRFESAKQRYIRTLEENPELIRRTPVHYIASYLQVRPETLSRVRTQVMNEGNK